MGGNYSSPMGAVWRFGSLRLLRIIIKVKNIWKCISIWSRMRFIVVLSKMEKAEREGLFSEIRFWKWRAVDEYFAVLANDRGYGVTKEHARN